MYTACIFGPTHALPNAVICTTDSTDQQLRARTAVAARWLPSVCNFHLLVTPSVLSKSVHRYVMPRPEGRRCLVISSQHMTISRHRNGSILHKFPSALPNGSRESSAGSGDDFCILDCVFHDANSVYYVLDMMCWKGYALYDCSAEFRLFWVQSKLAECLPGSGQEQQRYTFVPVPAFTCTQGDNQPLYMLHPPPACTLPPPPLPQSPTLGPSLCSRPRASKKSRSI